MEVFFRIFQFLGLIWMHFLCIQVSQESHWMAGWLFLHGREHTPQGYLTEVGPGLSSTSPDIIRSVNSQELELKLGLRFWTKLFLMLKEVDERGLEGDKTRLEYEIEKRVW